MNQNKTVDYNTLGVQALHQGDANTAIIYFKKGLFVNKKNKDCLNNLGNMFLRQKKYEKAIKYYKRAIKYYPNFSMAFNNLGIAFKNCNKINEALTYFKKATLLDAKNILALTNYATLLKHVGNLIDAKKIFLRLLEHNSQNFEVLEHLTQIAMHENEHEQTNYYLLKAHELQPHNLEIIENIAKSYRHLCNEGQALLFYEKYLHIQPQAPHILSAALYIKKNMGQWPTAQEIVFLKNAIEQAWHHNLASLVEPFELINLPVEPELQYKVAKERATRYSDTLTSPKFQHHTKKKNTKIKVGYISPDLYSHPVGLLIRDQFSLHNRKNFEIYAYHYGTISDELTQQIASGCDHFIDCSPYKKEVLAQTIYNDSIDILVDLSGHTKNNCLEVLALQPAPIQCHHIGYPASIGAEFIQYYFTSKTFTPPEQQPYFSEKLIYLPHTHIATPPFENFSKESSRANFNLSKDSFVFCYLNTHHRIESFIANLWMEILTQTPNSILWLRAGPLCHENTIKKMAMGFNIDIARIKFSAFDNLTETWPHQHANLWLDTHYCASGTASLLCGWAGLPMLTLQSNSHQSMSASSYAAAFNNTCLIATSAKDYIAKAVYYYHNRKELQNISSHLKSKRNELPPFAINDYIKDIELGFQEIYSNYINKVSNTNIYVEDIKRRQAL